MIDVLHDMIERYGLVAVFVGCLAEGEGAAMFGGFFAHQHVFDAGWTVAAAFAGAFLGDTALFMTGRRFANHPVVFALRARPGFSHAMGLVERHPDLFILTSRFLYGLRLVGGIAAGLSSVTVGRFLVLNAASALVWAALFVSLGYFFGAGAEQVSGGAFSHGERLALGAGLVVAVAALGVWFGLRLRNRRR